MMRAIKMMQTRSVFTLCFVAVLCCLFLWFFAYGTGNVEFKKKSGKDERGTINSKLPKKMDKINKSGEFKPFYGYTIISELQDNSKYTEIAEYIRNSKSLNKYFTPLPATSYHVTLFDVLTQRTMPERYIPKSGVVPSYRWHEAVENLKSDLFKAQEVCDRFEGNIVFKKDKYSVGSSGLSIHGTVSNMKEVTKFRDAISTIFKKSDDPRIFHMGLAYKFRVIDGNEIDSVKEELEYLLQYVVKDEYILRQPTVYYFETMEKFIPLKSLNF